MCKPFFIRVHTILFSLYCPYSASHNRQVLPAGQALYYSWVIPSESAENNTINWRLLCPNKQLKMKTIPTKVSDRDCDWQVLHLLSIDIVPRMRGVNSIFRVSWSLAQHRIQVWSHWKGLADRLWVIGRRVQMMWTVQTGRSQLLTRRRLGRNYMVGNEMVLPSN